MSVERAKYNPEAEDQKSVARIENYEIEELEEPIWEILRQLRESIKSGDFSTIIGDDASGRIPALIFGKFLNGYNTKHGLNKVETLFFAGSGRNPKEDFEHYIKSDEIEAYLKTQGLDRDVLIVTDTVSSGNSLRPLTIALKRIGKKYEIASVGKSTSNELGITEALGVTPKFGFKDRAPRVYGVLELAGVRKHTGDLFGKRYKDKYESEEAIEIQGNVNQARIDANQVAENLLDKFEELE